MSSQQEVPNTGAGGYRQPGADVLNGQQLSAFQKQMADKLAGIVKDVDLRKWSVDQACSLAGSALEFSAEKPIDAVTLARAIHAFLTEEAAHMLK
jgi:FKBP-type peptidyl-prolyl cis-trans isomerase 2